MKITLLLFLFLPSQIFAFSSVPRYQKGGKDIHAQITHKAIKKLKFGEISFRNIMAGNLIHDYVKVKINNPDLHCDRNRTTSHEKAARNCRMAAHKLIAQSVEAIKKGEYIKAQHLYGNSLHIFQDFISHSNFIDLKRLSQFLVKDFILNKTNNFPKGLKLTGWDHRTKKGERAGQLKGDKFSHDLFCKDNPTRNKESKKTLKSYKNKTKFQAAFKEAVKITNEVALIIKSKVSKKQWKAFRRITHL